MKPVKEKKSKKKESKTETESGSEQAATSQKRQLEESADAEVAPKAKAKATPKRKSKLTAVPDFQVCWENHAKLMAFYDLTEDEATTCLLSVVGEDEAGRQFWEKFKTKNDTPKDTPKEEAPMGPGKPMTRAEREMLEDSQLPEYEHEDTDLDSNFDASHSSGSALDQLETQVADMIENSMVAPPPPASVSQVWCFKSILPCKIVS